MSDLTIHVPSIEETPQRLRLTGDEGWWTAQSLPGDGGCERLLEPFVLDVEAYRIGRRLLFRGTLRGRVELVCGRCTEPFEYRMAEPLTLLLEPVPAGAEAPEGGLELDAEDLELGRYAGDELDFGPVLIETLLTSWPMQPRCSEGCRGLCPSCGADRNRTPCGCDEQDGNRPFGSLKELLARGQGTSKTPKS